MSGDARDFRAVTRFDGREATVALSGSFESIAAAELMTVLDAAIDRRPTRMMLDVTALDHMGVAGLIVLSNTEKRLEAFGTTFKVRTPSDIADLFASMVEVIERPPLRGELPDIARADMGGVPVNSRRSAWLDSSADLSV